MHPCFSCRKWQQHILLISSTIISQNYISTFQIGFSVYSIYCHHMSKYKSCLCSTSKFVLLWITLLIRQAGKRDRSDRQAGRQTRAEDRQKERETYRQTKVRDRLTRDTIIKTKSMISFNQAKFVYLWLKFQSLSIFKDQRSKWTKSLTKMDF